ncbi:uncharacterized protein M6B38_297880 [Iris pallida]|uniref:CCR4-NOT transcription complex subunit 4 n=1 Tax=Iris pallida TaxID=29817 RepID=A0AAX6HPZ6_IRIPA|nr:uncharacterized protein M6B38_297880 [Iris pallida]
MTTMSDDGDRTCPLCAEEMDLTDQQLKPCKCGYEICVWCWHHIMEMAEKEGSEGRCPACRTPYDKQRIEAANCKRMVSEISVEKKHKSQRTRNKTPSIEDRKHLSSVRVVQRNLVYIMGVPSNLADESILERKEYFGQYGKILKVSFSRQSGTTQQVSSNNTSSVYITYSREEEAVRCIQAVHNFVLEGKPLRACFGTTKYCYTWLRNMICSNPDCLYLHDIGSQEDNFTKDEIISAYTRSRVPQISSNNLQPRAGNMLPPPTDELSYGVAVSTKQATKSASNNTASQVRSSNDIGGTRSVCLPVAASWGLRSSSCRSPASSMACSQSSSRTKTEGLNIPSSSSMLTSTRRTSAWNDDTLTTSKVSEGTHMGDKDGRSRSSEPLRHGSDREYKVPDMSSGTILDAGHTSASAWDDDIITSVISEGGHKESSRPGGRGFVTSSLDTSEEIDMDEARPSAWDDDLVATSKVPEKRQSLVVDRFESWDTLEPGADSSQAHALDNSSKVVTVAPCTSGASSSFSSSPHDTPPKSNGGATVSVSVINTHPLDSSSLEGSVSQSNSSGPADPTYVSTAVNKTIDSLLLGLSTVKLENNTGFDPVSMGKHQNSSEDLHLSLMIGSFGSRLHTIHPETGSKLSSSVAQSSGSSISDAHVSTDLSDMKLELQKLELSSTRNRVDDNLAAADDHRLGLSGSSNPSCLSHKNSLLNVSNHLINISQNGDLGDKWGLSDKNTGTIGTEIVKGPFSFRENEFAFVNGHNKEVLNTSANFERVPEYPGTSHPVKEFRHSRGSNDIPTMQETVVVDKGEGTIVSDILSLEFDPWDDSWSSANNFAKLLGQMDKQDGLSKLSNSWKTQKSNHNESRFSFARQENQANLGDSSCRDINHAQRFNSLMQGSYENNFENTSRINNFEGANAIGNHSSLISCDRISGVSRANISAPPGFSVPNRAPPPGFSSHDRYDQDFNTCSETFPFGGSTHSQFQAYSAGNAGDVEFIDPAILAVGKGRSPLGVNNTELGLASAFPSHFDAFESDRRIQLLMQQAISANQDPRISNHVAERFSQFNDPYLSSRFPQQNPSNVTPFTQISHQPPSHALNGPWDGWNGVPIGNSMGIADVLRNERFGLNHYIPVNEEPKFRIPSPGDLYNRAFGM